MVSGKLEFRIFVSPKQVSNHVLLSRISHSLPLEAWRGYAYIDAFDTIPVVNKIFLKVVGAPIMYPRTSNLAKLGPTGLQQGRVENQLQAEPFPSPKKLEFDRPRNISFGNPHHDDFSLVHFK